MPPHLKWWGHKNMSREIEALIPGYGKCGNHTAP